MTIYEIAQSWVEAGISVFPCWYQQKLPMLKSWKEFQTRLPTNRELNSWFSHGLKNLAVVCGWAGLVVLDIENWDVYQAARFAFNLESFTVKTGRGAHVYLFAENPPETGIKFSWDAEIRTKGQYVLAPPSVHPSGAHYTVINPSPIRSIDSLADIIPPEFLEPRQLEKSAQVVAAAPLQAPVQQAVNPWEVANNPKSSGGIVNTIKQKINILNIYPWEQLRQTGNGWYIAVCPWHDDHNPSLAINTKTNMVTCLAGCTSKALDPINTWARLRGIDNQAAIKELSALV